VCGPNVALRDETARRCGACKSPVKLEPPQHKNAKETKVRDGELIFDVKRGESTKTGEPVARTPEPHRNVSTAPFRRNRTHTHTHT
jgi:hypothetical protein